MNKYLVLICFWVIVPRLCIGKETSHTKEINFNWEYTHFPYCDTDKKAIEMSSNSIWRPAIVPGNVHLDLQRDGILPDLNFGLNFYSSIWVENEDFMYRTTFNAIEFKAGNTAYIDFDGLDCFATVWLNGTQIAKTHNMFKTYSFEVTDVLKPTGNLLVVRLASPMKEVYKQVPGARERMDKLSCAFNVKERLITRKAQMNYGWDNVPRIITTGIYRPVKLRVCKAGSFDNVWFRTQIEKDHSSANANVIVEITGNSIFEGELEVVLVKDDKKISETQKIEFTEDKQTRTTNIPVKITNPELWWPAGLGKQPLYQLSVNLKKEGKLMDTYTEKVAFRDIKVITAPSEKRVVNYRIGNPDNKIDVMDGGFAGAWSKVPLKQPEEVELTPFKFYVNGQYVFIKGWNYQPLDVFEAKVTREKYYRSVEAAKEAGANMLRIWGGGNVENPAFYDACDEKGILVWQDFFYASGQYPNDDDFLKEIEDETQNVVKHLRNRASVAAWCGDNESDMVNHDRGVGQFANKITHVVQKNVLSIYDPDRFWHPSSPSGGGYPRSPWGGDKRNWGAAFPDNDYAHIRSDEARFISEGGAASIAQLSSFRKYMPSSYEWPVNSDYYFMHWGDVPTMRRDFPQTVMGNITKYFGKPENVGDLIYLSQVFQAHGLTKMAHHFRKRMNECGGVLMWKWADTWPSVCLSVIDYDEYKKASWYTVKKAFSQRSLMMDNSNNNLSVWYLNDLPEMKSQLVKCQIKKCDGTLIQEWSATLDFKGNSSGKALELNTKRADFNNGEYYFKMWIDNNPAVKPVYYVPCDMVRLKSLPGKITVAVERNSPTNVTLTFKSDEFAPYVLITGNNPYINMSDNAFFIEKGEEKKVILSVPEGELWGDFSYTWWNNGKQETFTVESDLLKPIGLKSPVQF